MERIIRRVLIIFYQTSTLNIHDKMQEWILWQGARKDDGQIKGWYKFEGDSWGVYVY